MRVPLPLVVALLAATVALPASATTGSTSNHRRQLDHGHGGLKEPVKIAPASQWLLSPTFKISDVPQTRTYNFTIDARLGAPDGFERPLFVVNGQIDGPLIEANQGDTISVKVQNNLNTGISIHGISQNGSTWADGPNGITQCPIPPFKSFTYTFTLTRFDQFGTYWWHAHRGAMYGDGITGPLIVHSLNDPLKRGQDYDVDQILFIRDHFHSMSTDIVDGLLSAAGTIIAPSPKSGLINSVGIFNCTAAPSDSTCTQRTEPLELVFAPQTRIRLRLINAGTHAQFKFSADEHVLKVIEADDTAVNALEVHRIPFFTAQRYSAILDLTNNKAGDSFFLRAQMNTQCFGASFADLDPDVKAIVRVAVPGTRPGTETPTSTDWSDAVNGACIDLDENSLVPLLAVDAPEEVGITNVFDAAFNFTQVTGTGRWTLNAVSFENFMYNPLLFQVRAGKTLDALDVTQFVIPELQTADLIVNNLLGADHPFHLHGSKFFIVARGNGTLSASNATSISYTTTNPLRRDTLTIPTGEFAVLRFIADIPGVHAFHCHIAWHQAAGLVGVVVVQPSAIETEFVPDGAFQICDPTNFEPGDSILTTDPGRRRGRRSVLELAGSDNNSLVERKRNMMGWTKKHGAGARVAKREA
ncbi:hypothetical protein RQP46_005382 [Phenoliferia psychrophenolica]